MINLVKKVMVNYVSRKEYTYVNTTQEVAMNKQISMWNCQAKFIEILQDSIQTRIKYSTSQQFYCRIGKKTVIKIKNLFLILTCLDT